MRLDMTFEESEQTFEMNVAGSIVVNGGGKDGKDGYTPQKGIDYWTEEDKQEIVDEVIEQLPDIPSGGGVNADWSQNDPTAPDFVKNRTHWKEEHKIEWDGSTDGRDSFDASAMGFGVLYKVSDEVWTMEQAFRARLYSKNISDGTEGVSAEEPSIILEDDTIGFAALYRITEYGGLVAFFAKQAIDLTSVYGFSVPSAGCYFFFTLDVPLGIFAMGIQIPTVIHKLDYEFLPEDIATEAKVEEMISNALGAVENGTY